ncbi:MAG: DUF4384 domain-containing protein [Prevotella sp.]|nr:DUF4384 domain-containing protein [Prevotella sp.]
MRQAVVFILMMLSLSAFAQKVKTVEGEYTYHAPENVTVEQAKITAYDRAKIQALADEFGTIVQQLNTTRMENRNGESNTDFFSIGGSEVKGEWIADVDDPKYTISYVDNTLVVTCKVKGKAREIVTSKIDFHAHVLRNGTDDKYEDEDFKAGDDLFLSFRSPVNGYLAVYLIDAERQAYCLLPYRTQMEGAYAIEGNRRYVFFSTKDVPKAEQPFVDEYNMTCEHSEEHNLIYVVFSPNQFVKAVDRDSDGVLPRQLSYKELQQWLAKCRKFDPQMDVRPIPMNVRK